MASPVEAFNLVSERKEQLRKVFTEFEAKKFSLGRIGATWKDIEEHFKEIETCLEKTHEAYKAKEKAFETRKKSVQAELAKRDADVSAKEQASVRRVQTEKDAAVTAIREHRRKLADDKRRWEAEKQRTEGGGLDAPSSKKETQPMKNTDTVKTSSQRDTHVKKDADTDKTSFKKETDAKKGAHGSSAKKESPAKKASTQDEKAPASSKKAGEIPASYAEKESVKGNGAEEHTSVHKEPRPKLKSICQNMDFDGFRKLIVENQKELKVFQNEVPSALKLCSDPAQLVLKTLEGYLDIEKKGNRAFGKDDCFACTMLLESLSEMQGENPTISAKVKKSAKEFGDKWKAVLKLEGQIGFNLVLVGRSFLQFVASFGLSNEYDHDDLCDIVAKVARPNQTPTVFRLLGLSDKAPDVIEKLIKDGKPIPAVSFAAEFNLLERFPPAPLLKAHIKDARKSAKTILKNGSKTLAAQNEALQKELAALKAVANVVKEYKLEGHYTLDYVDKQVANLERTKADRKRAATTSKAQQPSKKPRMDDGSPSGGRSRTPSPERPLHGMRDKDPYEGTRIPPFAGVAIPEFDRRPHGEYDRRPLGEFDRRAMEEYDRRPLGEFEHRRLGLYDPGYTPQTGNPALPSPYGHASLGLTSLGYRSSAQGGQPGPLSGYGYPSGLSSLGMGGFKPYL